MQTILNAMRIFDIFGYPIGLRLNRQSYYKTQLGGCVSITIFTIMILIFFSSFISFLTKQELRAVAVIEYEDFPEQLKLDESDFMIAFQIEQDNFLTNSYFSISLQQMTYNLLQDGTRKKQSVTLNLIPCTIDRFQKPFNKKGKDFTEDFNRLRLNQFLCPDYESTISLQGSYTNSDFQFLKISVIQCQTSQCATQEEKESYLNAQGSFNILIYTINQIVSPQKSDEEYLQVFLDDSLHFTFVPEKLVRSANIYVKNYEFNTDESLLPFRFQSISLLAISQIERFTLLINRKPKKQQNSPMMFPQIFPLSILGEVHSKLKQLEVILKLMNYSQISEEYNRSFSSPQASSLVFTIDYNVLNLLKVVSIELANNIFEFSYNTQQNIRENEENLQIISKLFKDKVQKRSDTENSMNESDYAQKVYNSVIKQKQNNENKLSSQLNTDRQVQLVLKKDVIFEIEDQSKRPFELFKLHQQMAIKLKCKSGLEYFQKQIWNIINRSKPIYLNFQMLINFLTLNKCFGNSKRIILMRKALDSIAEQIDLYQILNRVNEIDKIKDTLLSYKQQLLFGFTPKPQITLDQNPQQPNRNLLLAKQKPPRIRSSNDQIDQKIINISTQDNADSVYFMYAKIYNAYDDILKRGENQQRHKSHNINQQLIQKLGAELQLIFKVSKLLDKQLKTQKNKEKTIRRGGMQQEEDDIFLKMFDSNN